MTETAVGTPTARLLIVGPPGAGKGTQASRIAAAYGVPAISTGDIFRANIKEQTPLGVRVKAILDAGDLVPDALTNDLIADRISQADAEHADLEKERAQQEHDVRLEADGPVEHLREDEPIDEAHHERVEDRPEVPEERGRVAHLEVARRQQPERTPVPGERRPVASRERGGGHRINLVRN